MKKQTKTLTIGIIAIIVLVTAIYIIINAGGMFSIAFWDGYTEYLTPNVIESVQRFSQFTAAGITPTTPNNYQFIYSNNECTKTEDKFNNILGGYSISCNDGLASASWGITKGGSGYQYLESESKVYISNNKINLYSNKGSPSLNFLQLNKGYDVKASVTLNGIRGSTASILLNGVSVCSITNGISTYKLCYVSNPAVILNCEIKHSELEPNKYYVIQNGDETNMQSYDIGTGDTLIISTSVQSGGSGCNDNQRKATLTVDRVAYKIPTSCAVSEDETRVQLEINEGETITMDKIQRDYFGIKKICPIDMPTQILTKNIGLSADSNNEIWSKLFQGEEVVVPIGKTYTLYYITKFVEGNMVKCSAGSAYSFSQQKCILYTKEAEIVPLACSSDADCKITLSCGTSQGVCVSGKCVDFVSAECESEQVKNQLLLAQEQISKAEEAELVELRSGKYAYTKSLTKYNKDRIGDAQLSAQSISYVCNDPNEQGTLVNSYKNPECFQTVLVIGNQQLTFKGGETQRLFHYIDITYYPVAVYGGDYDENDEYYWKIRDGWKNTFLISINPMFYEIQSKVDSYFVATNSNKAVEFNIYNKIPIKFENSEFRVNYKYEMVDGYSEDKVQIFALPAGESTSSFQVPIDTKTNGIETVTITPVVKIDDSNTMIHQQLITNYLIAQSNPFTEKQTEVIIQYVNNQTTVYDRFFGLSQKDESAIIAIIVIFICGFVYVTYKLTKKRRR